MKVLIFLANGFEELEAIAPIDIFRRAGISVTTVSIEETLMVEAAHGVTVFADKVFTQVDFSDADLLFLPGGMPGTKKLSEHGGLRKVILEHYQMMKPIAAICAAPSILGDLGLLQGREAVCYPGFEHHLVGATISDKSIVKSGLIYTASGAGVSVQFALSLVAAFIGSREAEKLAEKICSK